MVRATVSSSLAPVLAEVVARLRGLFDLDAHPSSIDAALAHDALLAPLVKARPGVRLVGAFDGFETALRAVLGQQVSVKGATTLSGRLAAKLGTPVVTPFPELSLAWPSAKAVANVDASFLARHVGLPAKRAATIVALARAADAGELCLERHADRDETLARLDALPGIGDWTAQYLAMRVLGWPDAFPASDLGLLRALGVSDARRARVRAEAWSPWRAYAAMRLWMQHGSTSRGGES
jgi:AraC family transcriptional regulator of adaptative response / DNA-3-methyladenine glycosylase II